MKGIYKIDKNAHYFAIMSPYDMVIPCMGIALVNGNEKNWVECEVVEDRYKVDDGYKVTLRPIDERFATQHFYQNDFIQLLNDGRIIKKENDNQHIERVVCAEHISGSAFIIHSAYCVVE